MWLGLLKILEPIFGPILTAMGLTFNDYLARTRAEQAQRDLGRTTAERDQERAGREAAEREVVAAQSAPKTVDDAVRRLEEGSA